MSITPMHPYLPQHRPLANITPFTYRDGLTYADKLHDMGNWLNDVIAFVNENFKGLDEGFETEVNRLIDAINAQLEAQSASVDAKNAALDENVVAALATVDDIVTAMNLTLSTQDQSVADTIAQATTYVNGEIDSLRSFVNASVESIINNSVQVQDSVIEGVVNDSASGTRIKLDALYLGEAANDGSVANNILNPETATSIALTANFANRATQTEVEAGRLSIPELAATIASAIENIDHDILVSGIAQDSESLIREALDQFYAPKLNPNKWRSWRPSLNNFMPGIDGFIDGKYWFDGVAVHVELIVQASAAAAAPMGTQPTVSTPSQMIPVTGAAATIHQTIGHGHIHDATTGLLHALVVQRAIPTGNTESSVVRLRYPNGTQFNEINANAPISWGILDGVTMKFSYIPANKTAPKNFAAYGDSITRFTTAASGINPNWPAFVGTEGLTFAGGYAIDSGTSAQVLAGAKEISADVAVCMIGVNDIAQSVPLGTTTANVLALKNKIKADNFILCKIAPYDANPTAANAMNVAYQTLADNNGWPIIDPYAAYREANGRWKAGASGDGVHPTTAVQQAAAAIIRNAINAL